MTCPKCNASMELVTYEGVTIDRCTQCKGIWFDANEQKWLKEKKGSEVIDNGDAASAGRWTRSTIIVPALPGADDPHGGCGSAIYRL